MKIEIIVTQKDDIEDEVIDTLNSEEIERKIQDIIIEKVTEERQYENQDTTNKVNKINKEKEEVEINKNQINMVTTRSMELVDSNKRTNKTKIIKGIECKPEELIELQQNDESFKNIREKIMDEKTDIVEGGSIYF